MGPCYVVLADGQRGAECTTWTKTNLPFPAPANEPGLVYRRLRPRGNHSPSSPRGPSAAHARNAAMEEGTKAKKTVYVGGIGDEVNEETIVTAFSPFGAFSVLVHEPISYRRPQATSSRCRSRWHQPRP